MAFGTPAGNPLLSDSPSAWNDLIESVGLAALLVAIQSRMSQALQRKFTPEDVLQEALMHAWRDRRTIEWRGLRAFRSWLLSIADHRIHDLADRESARKRGAEAVIHSLAQGPGSDAGPGGDGSMAAITSTTPSRVAIRREQAAAMSAALAELPDDLQGVVRLRIFEQMSIEEIAARLGIGESAVRHRFRRGAEEYQAQLRRLLSRTNSAAGARPD